MPEAVGWEVSAKGAARVVEKEVGVREEGTEAATVVPMVAKGAARAEASLAMAMAAEAKETATEAEETYPRWRSGVCLGSQEGRGSWMGWRGLRLRDRSCWRVRWWSGGGCGTGGG